MHPTLFVLNGVPLHTWGTLVTLAFVAAFGFVHLRAARVGIDPDRLVPLYILVLIAGIVGARLLHFGFAEPRTLWDNPMAFFSSKEGGFAFYGGVIGGVTAGATYARLRGISVWKLADLAAPAIMLGLGLGRVGCFFAGCCHGRPMDEEADAVLMAFDGGDVVRVGAPPYVGLVFNGLGVTRITDTVLYPTQLAEILTGFGLFTGLVLIWSRYRRFDGIVLATMLTAYAFIRTTNETFRGDVVRGLFELGPLTVSTSQLVAAGMVGVAAVIVALRFRSDAPTEQPFRATEEEIPPLPTND